MDKQSLINVINHDPTLSPEDKAAVLSDISNGKFDSELIHGAIGAGIGLAISKFFKMSKSAQALITLAGFGIGKYLLEESRKHDKFVQYDKESKVYKINA